MKKGCPIQTGMDELFVYALLCIIGYDEYQNYERILDNLFLENPANDEILDLMGRTDKDAVLHTFALMNSQVVDKQSFGKNLMMALKPIYITESIYSFARHMYKLWTLLPDYINRTDPFFIFCYADDCLDHGNVENYVKRL